MPVSLSRGGALFLKRGGRELWARVGAGLGVTDEAL
jgi:hypothetical protein